MVKYHESLHNKLNRNDTLAKYESSEVFDIYFMYEKERKGTLLNILYICSMNTLLHLIERRRSKMVNVR